MPTQTYIQGEDGREVQEEEEAIMTLGLETNMKVI